MELVKRIEKNMRSRASNLWCTMSNQLDQNKTLIRACALTAMMVCAIMMVFFTVALNGLESRYTERLEQLMFEQTQSIQQIEASYQYDLDVMRDQHAAEAKMLNAQISAKDAQIETLQNDHYNDYKTASYLLTKYDYVFDRMPSNSGITLSDIAYYDDMCKANNWNPHIMWCIYWNESRFTAVIDNPVSSARGLGQILESTGRYIYTNILGLGTYDHSMAYDVRTNMMLTTELLYYYMDGGLAHAVASYSSDFSGEYYRLVCANAAEFGVDISTTTYQ